MRRYLDYGWAVWVSGFGPLVNAIGVAISLIGGSVAAWLLGWSWTSVAAIAAATLLLVALIGGYRVNRETVEERDKAQEQADQAPQQVGIMIQGEGNRAWDNKTYFVERKSESDA